jgi:excisionase family DNA binding protein
VRCEINDILGGKIFMSKKSESKIRAATKSDVAEYYGVTIRTVEHWMSRGWLPYRKLGKLVRMDLEECKVALAQKCGRNKLEAA